MEVKFLNIEEHFLMKKYWHICMLVVLREFNPKFVCPQMYYYLDKYPDLYDFIKDNATDIGELRVNLFENIGKEDICRKHY